MDDREELDHLVGETERPTLSPDGQWRADYRRAQRQRRLAGAQPDLFGGADGGAFSPKSQTTGARRSAVGL